MRVIKFILFLPGILLSMVSDALERYFDAVERFLGKDQQ